ncbi:hypothetical protein PILCRDRAFT_215175 [Piloderma croceum F 1598]|uniref:SH3 domain-containing protein n=1 Tax=Piloderma croceum (strain F 1598) TaxID=765440 RepID=A0A0C3GEV8_PILCF|nr:hypothetical protein PILCRDRAFT_215175 [Piloderma croceum F 1598]
MFAEATKTSLPGPLQSHPYQGSGKYGLYDYAAQGSDELGISEDEMIELSGGPNSGQNYGDGWWEGINSKGQKGIFPSNYSWPDIIAVLKKKSSLEDVLAFELHHLPPEFPYSLM